MANRVPKKKTAASNRLVKAASKLVDARHKSDPGTDALVVAALGSTGLAGSSHLYYLNDCGTDHGCKGVYVVSLTPAPDLLARTASHEVSDNEEEFNKRESIRTALERVCKKLRQHWHVVVMPSYALEIPKGAVKIPMTTTGARA